MPKWLIMVKEYCGSVVNLRTICQIHISRYVFFGQKFVDYSIISSSHLSIWSSFYIALMLLLQYFLPLTTDVSGTTQKPDPTYRLWAFRLTWTRHKPKKKYFNSQTLTHMYLKYFFLFSANLNQPCNWRRFSIRLFHVWTFGTQFWKIHFISNYPFGFRTTSRLFPRSFRSK